MINETPTPELKMDEIWTAFDGVTESFEKFIQQFMPDLYLKPEVHKDVVENIRVIRKLIECSYFEYKIYDVAVLKTALTMEMAMKLRYTELTSEKWDARKPLINLIKWFEDRNYFEAYYPEYMDNMRKIRNTLAHPNEHQFGGASGAQIIQRIVDIINGLYEDPVCRVARKEIMLKIIKIIDTFHGRMVCVIDNKRYLVYRAWPGFVNNKDNVLEIHFYYKPTCTFPEEFVQNNHWVMSPVLYFKASQIELLVDSIKLINLEGTQLVLSKIKDDDDEKSFDNWVINYGSLCDKTGQCISIKGKIIDPFLIHLRDFHRML